MNEHMRTAPATAMRRLALALVLALLPICVIAEESCFAGVVFGFFNGVKTTEQQAKQTAFDHLEILYGPTTPAGEPITYELFYNDTQGFTDFVETFEQRLQEQNGLLAGRFELFFSATQGEGGWWNALTSAIPSLAALLGSFFDAYTTAAVKGLISGVGEPGMASVSARHKEQIDRWAGLNRKMLFLAHSQGNLFVNQARTHAVGRTGNEHVRVIHVAPASPTLSGRHTLADKDSVINALRLTGTVAAITDLIPGYVHRPAGLNGSRDLIGHGLLEIYLNPALSTAGRIRDDVVAALHELDAAPRKPMPPYPAFVRRPWEGGSAPVGVYAPNQASHQLQKIVRRDTVGAVWKLTPDFRWKNVTRWSDRPPESGIFKTSTIFVGEEMNGSVECTYNLPLEGWIDTWSHECTYEKVPVKERLIYLRLFVPDELQALGRVPEGTVVTLKEMTFSNLNIDPVVSDLDTPQASIEFYSGFMPTWDLGIQNKLVWREPYWFKHGALLNAQAQLDHAEAYRQYERAEWLRFEQHELLRLEHERKRMACG